MAQWLKRGATAEAKRDADKKVREIVEAALADIEDRGDAAVREMSVKFDGWDREDYRLSQSEIDACVDALTPQERKPVIERGCSISISIRATTPANRRRATDRLSVRSERQISTRFIRR